MKFTTKILLLFSLLCVTTIASFVAAYIIFDKLHTQKGDQPQITSEFVEHEIQEISELATLHHHYTKAASFQDVKKLIDYLPNWRINNSVKEFRLIYKGDVKIGYNLKDIRIQVDNVDRTIFIAMPEPKILSHSIDFNSIDVLQENKGWFNQIKFEDFQKFFAAEQRKYEDANIDELKKRAREQAEKIILLYLSTTIDIATPEEENHKNFFEKWLHPDNSYGVLIK